MLARWLVAATVLLLLGSRIAVCQEDAATEFADIAEAAAFGWEVNDHTVLTVTNEGKVGKHALRAQPQPGAEPYRTINLVRDVDLSGAGPDDKIVFWVKQNLGSGMRIQLWTDKGPFNRSFPATFGDWTRIELDLDLDHWEHPQNPDWDVIRRIAFYERAFQSEDQYMILDGLDITVGGRSMLMQDPVHAITSWTFPHETDGAWFLGNEYAAWAISKSTGQVLGAWNVQTRERYLNSLEGRYHLEDNQLLVTGRESADTVTRAEFSGADQRIELTCHNAEVPDLTITKRYWLDGKRLRQRVGVTTSIEKLQFVTYNSEATFTRAYRNGGYYMGGADGGGPLIPAPQLSAWHKVTEYQNTAKGMLLHQPEKGYSFAQVRTKLDDSFVWPYFTGAIASYVEAVNMLHYTPNGWDMSLGTSKLSARETSYEQYLSIFEGDWQTFLREEYPSLPEVQEALSEIPPVPEWVGNIKAQCNGDIDRLRHIVETTDEGDILVLFSLSGSWADYYVDEGMEGNYGGWITGPELRDHIGALKAVSPRVKVCIYQWMLSTYDRTRIYRSHPEWFRYADKDGQRLSTFPGLAPNFAHLLSIRECYDELLHQIDLVLGYLDVDLIYLDDPKAINMIDWRSGEYTRDDLSFDFFRDVRRIVAKHGPDKATFFNNQCNPYGDVNFIEARAQLRANYWRQFVGIAAVDEQFVSATRPDGRINLLYFTPPLRREYMNRVLALGWVPSWDYCDVVATRPFFQAAYEVGNSSPIPARYSPDWRRDKQTQVESYAVQRPDDSGYLFSFINHAEKPQRVPVSIDLGSLNMSTARRVFVWEHIVEDAMEFEGTVTEALARQVYRDTRWQLDRPTRRRLLYAGPYRAELKLELDMQPLILHQLYVTAQPAAVYSEDGLPTSYLFGRTQHLTVEGATEWTAETVGVEVNSAAGEAEIILALPSTGYAVNQATLDGKPVAVDWVWEGDDRFPLVTVSKGRHTLVLEFDTPKATQPTRIEGLSATAGADGISLSVPGAENALVCVAQGDQVLFNRVVSGAPGALRLPPSPVRAKQAEYAVSVRAVGDADGRLRPVQGAQTAVTLPAAPPAIRLKAEIPPLMPATLQVTPINRTSNGLQVLSSATAMTAIPENRVQPGLPSMTASVNPDALSIEAGTTRAIEQGGAAFAGLEIKDLRRAEVRLTNSFHDAFHIRGPGYHVPERPNSRNFAGIVIDYHTPAGYTRRVRLATGVLHRECSSTQPEYGKGGPADEARDLGIALIERPETVFALDLSLYAPEGWDGQVWLSVGSDWIGSDRRLGLQILAANDHVTADIIAGTDPKAFQEAYEKPRLLQVPRAPGGIMVDGSLSEEWWKEGARTEEFYLIGGAGISKAATSAMLLYDDVNLYVAFTCAEPDRKKPLIIGGPPWDDDEVEVWIDANNDGKTFHQVIVNALNSKLEYRESGQSPFGATTATHVDEGSAWMVEMAIPFAGMGVAAPKPGDEWKISLCRGRPPGEDFNHELIVWAPLKSGGFNDLANFGTLRFR